MTNANVNVTQIAVLGGASNEGYKLGIVLSGAKAAQNDTWTVKNAAQVFFGVIMDDSSGVIDATDIDATTVNKILMSNASTGAATGFLIYK